MSEIASEPADSPPRLLVPLIDKLELHLPVSGLGPWRYDFDFYLTSFLRHSTDLHPPSDKPLLIGWRVGTNLGSRRLTPYFQKPRMLAFGTCSSWKAHSPVRLNIVPRTRNPALRIATDHPNVFSMA